nr:Hsp70 family protein [Micromonospora sp. DSM 115978]
MDVSAVRLGVDFGTSNTVAVISVDGRQTRPLLFDGSPLLPSAVCVDGGGRLLVGRDAQYTALTRPESFEPYPKRCLDDGTVLLGETGYPVADLIAAVLGRVAEEARRAGGGPVTEPVLTCPAGWGPRRRETLLAAATTVLPGAMLVVEPVAAANRLLEVAAGRVPPGATALVYDFGAGTFDATVLRRTGDGFEVLATEGLTDAGGLDVDAAIVEHLGATLSQRDAAGWTHLLAPATLADRRASRQLWENVRMGKEMLARTAATGVHVPLLDVEAPLGREELDRLAGPVLERTVQACRTALTAAGVPPEDLAVVFLAGGSSRLPAVATTLHRAFGMAPFAVDQPELVVAEGSLRTAPGPAVAVGPAAGLGVGPGAGGAGDPWPRERAASTVVPTGRRTRRLAMVVGAAAVLAIAVPVAVVAAANLSDRDDVPSVGDQQPSDEAPDPTAPTPTPTPTVPAWLDSCLFGTWQRTSSSRTLQIDNKPTLFTGRTGLVATYRPDGTGTIVFKAEPPGVAVVNGVRWEEIVQGRATFTYRITEDGHVLYSDPQTKGTWKLTRNGRYNNGGKLELNLKPVRYSCSDEVLVEVSEGYSVQSERVTPGT